MARHETRILSLTRKQRYGIAVLGVILAAIVSTVLDPILGADLPLFLFVLPVIVAGWYGGLWPGLLATVLSLLIGDYLFISPRGSIFPHEDLLGTQRVLTFAFTGTVVSILCDKTRKAIKAQLECLERFGILVESVPDYAIFTTDPQGRFTCWNNGAQRIKGTARVRFLDMISQSSMRPRVPRVTRLEPNWKLPGRKDVMNWRVGTHARMARASGPVV